MICPWLFMLFFLSNVLHLGTKCKNALFSYIFSLYFAKKYIFFAFDLLKLILKVYCYVNEIP